MTKDTEQIDNALEGAFPAEGTEYTSNSTIDKPPREPKETSKVKSVNEEGQTSFLDANDEKGDSEDSLTRSYVRQFKTELTLKLADTETGKAVTIPLLTGTYAGDRVTELMALSLESKRNNNIIEATLDLPEERRSKKESIEFTVDGVTYTSSRNALTARAVLKIVGKDPEEYNLLRKFKDQKDPETLEGSSVLCLTWKHVEYYLTELVVKETTKGASKSSKKKSSGASVPQLQTRGKSSGSQTENHAGR